MALDIHKKTQSASAIAAYPNVFRTQWNYLPSCLFKIMLEYLPSNHVACTRGVCKTWKINCEIELSLRDLIISDPLFPKRQIGRKSAEVERLTKQIISRSVIPCKTVHTILTTSLFFGSRHSLTGDHLLVFHPNSITEWNLDKPERPAIRCLGPKEINSADHQPLVKVCQFANTFLLAKRNFIQIWDQTQIACEASDKKPLVSLKLFGELVDCDLKDSCIALVHKGFQGMYINPDFPNDVTRFQPIASAAPIASIHILESSICTISCSLSGENRLTIWDRTTLQATHNVINPCYLLDVKQLHLQQNQISTLHRDGTLRVRNYMTGALIYGCSDVHSFYRCGNLMMISTGTQSIYIFNLQKRKHICTLVDTEVTTPNHDARVHILCNLNEGTISTLTQRSMDISVVTVRQWKIIE